MSANQFVLKNVVINFPVVFHAKSINGSAPKYSACLLIGKEDIENLNRYQEALEAAYEAGEKKLASGKEMPKLEAIHCPLQDGDLKKPGVEEYANRFYINASNKNRPKVVGRDLRELTEEDGIWSGCIVNASLTLYAYRTDVSKGIACALEGIQLVKRGERFGFMPKAADMFEALDGDEEDDLPF